MIRKTTFFSFLALIYAVLGCKSSNLAPKSSLENISYPVSLLWKKDTYSVCWLVPRNTTIQRLMIRNHIEENFDRVPVFFTGWTDCTKKDKSDIKIFFFDHPDTLSDAYRARVVEWFVKAHPQSPGISRAYTGWKGKRAPANVVLSLYGKAWPSQPQRTQDIYQKNDSYVARMNIIRSSALHEFGHVLGFRHEESHEELLETCKHLKEGRNFSKDEEKETIVTPYNYTSFMSQCYYRQLDYENQALEMNENDVEATRLLLNIENH